MRVYHELPDAELVGVYDKDAAREAEVARECNRRNLGRARKILLHCAQGTREWA